MSLDGSADLQGKGVVITGGGSGIGQATAWAFANAGAKVLVVGRTPVRLAETAKGHPTIASLALDITVQGAEQEIIATAERELGRLDVLVNNAGITRPQEFGAIKRETVMEQFETNLFAPFFLSQAAIPLLEASSGIIINVTSIPGHRGWPRNSAYGASKVALDFLTRTWAMELAPRKIRVAAVSSGPVEGTRIMQDSGLDAQTLAKGRAALLERIPLRRMGRPDEIAFWILQLARPQAAYATGLVISVDGGGSVA